MRRTGLLCGFILLIIWAAPQAWAGTDQPPDYGTQNPTGLDFCPPEFLGVEKCFPAAWAFDPSTVPPSHGVHIVTDPLREPSVGLVNDQVPAPEPGAAYGSVTFWCQSVTGFKYQLRFGGLEAGNVYTVTGVGGGTSGPISLTFGQFRADANGLATVNGVERFAPGGYEIVIQVWDGSTLVLDSHLDPQGFGVFEGGPGVKG